MKSVLLDTDACIEIIRGNPEPLERVPEAHCLISIISRFEILSGLRSRGSKKREARARQFLQAVELVGFDEESASHAAAVRIQLEERGQSIGAYDLLIAGQALAHDLPLLTGNLREFGRVPGLEIIGLRPPG